MDYRRQLVSLTKKVNSFGINQREWGGLSKTLPRVQLQLNDGGLPPKRRTDTSLL